MSNYTISAELIDFGTVVGVESGIGHLFWSLKDENGNVVQQLHGYGLNALGEASTGKRGQGKRGHSTLFGIVRHVAWHHAENRPDKIVSSYLWP